MKAILYVVDTILWQNQSNDICNSHLRSGKIIQSICNNSYALPGTYYGAGGGKRSQSTLASNTSIALQRNGAWRKYQSIYTRYEIIVTLYWYHGTEHGSNIYARHPHRAQASVYYTGVGIDKKYRCVFSQVHSGMI